MSIPPILNARPQTCRRFLADWAGALTPPAPIFQAKAEGGAGVLAANSAALFRLSLMDRDEQVRLHHGFNDWLDEQAQVRQTDPYNWTLEETIEHLGRARKVLVFGFVYRELERHIGVRDVNESLAAASLWAFGTLDEEHQRGLVDHVESRHAEQCVIDEQALDCLQRIYAAAA